jgi:hypothetical protein
MACGDVAGRDTAPSLEELSMLFDKPQPIASRPQRSAMRASAIIYADEDLIRRMDDKVYEQAVNVATLPRIVRASYAMPDAHWGYRFPIGGVTASRP